MEELAFDLYFVLALYCSFSKYIDVFSLLLVGIVMFIVILSSMVAKLLLIVPFPVYLFLLFRMIIDYVYILVLSWC